MRHLLRPFIRSSIRYIDSLLGNKAILTRTADLHSVIERECLKKFMHFFKVDCVFDVGANDGQYAQFLRDQVGYSGTIISFEPIPECAERLRVLASSDPLWHIEQVALSDRPGTCSMNIMADSQFSSLANPKSETNDFFEQRNSVSRRIEVTVGTIAEYFSIYKEKIKFERPYLKMDTQGNDLKVATGAGSTLQSFYGIQSEVSIIPLYEQVPNYNESIAFYESQGFKLTAFVPNNKGHFPQLFEMDCVMYNTRFFTGDR